MLPSTHPSACSVAAGCKPVQQPNHHSKEQRTHLSACLVGITSEGWSSYWLQTAQQLNQTRAAADPLERLLGGHNL